MEEKINPRRTFKIEFDSMSPDIELMIIISEAIKSYSEMIDHDKLLNVIEYFYKKHNIANYGYLVESKTALIAEIKQIIRK